MKKRFLEFLALVSIVALMLVTLKVAQILNLG